MEKSQERVASSFSVLFRIKHTHTYSTLHLSELILSIYILINFIKVLNVFILMCIYISLPLFEFCSSTVTYSNHIEGFTEKENDL